MHREGTSRPESIGFINNDEFGHRRPRVLRRRFVESIGQAVHGRPDRVEVALEHASRRRFERLKQAPSPGVAALGETKSRLKAAKQRILSAKCRAEALLD